MSRAFVKESFESLADQLADVGRHCYERGWALGTSGNFSAVVRKEPLTLAITTSGVDKGLLESSQIVAVVIDRKSTRLNSSHGYISYAVFCLKKKKKK